VNPVDRSFGSGTYACFPKDDTSARRKDFFLASVIGKGLVEAAPFPTEFVVREFGRFIEANLRIIEDQDFIRAQHERRGWHKDRIVETAFVEFYGNGAEQSNWVVLLIRAVASRYAKRYSLRV
jgi:hypothetical protein